MKLLLTSNGIADSFKDAFLNLLSKPPQEISVSFITTAAHGEPDDPSWLDEYKDALKNLGITKIEDLDLKGKTKEELQEILKDKDIIFVNGGNTYYLLKYVKESGFADLLPELLKEGKLYVGVSAGSIILGPEISLAKWPVGIPDINVVELTDTTGLSLVPFAIFPHIKETYVETLKDLSKNFPHPLWLLNDSQAVLVEDNNYQLVGGGEEIIYNKQNG